jgi:hypothetical protein
MTKPMWRLRRLEEGWPLKVIVPCRFMCLRQHTRSQRSLSRPIHPTTAVLVLHTATSFFSVVHNHLQQWHSSTAAAWTQHALSGMW